MKISLDWLSEFVVLTEKNSSKIKEVITTNTAEVETMETQGDHLENIVVGKLVEIKDHPNADSLRLTKVFDGNEEVQVVCGGNNLREGMTVALARIGAVVRWHGTEVVKMQKAKIRGEESFGMICASDEIGLSELFPKHQEKEIVDLSHLNLTPGKPLAEALGLGDTVLDIDNHAITNRSDLFSHRGFAREFVANGLATWEKRPAAKWPKKNSPAPLEVSFASKEVCSRYMGVYLTGIEVKDSPEWMKKRLSACGVNPINNIVDITNYVMLELGMPLHAFDMDQFKSKKWTVRKSKKGEKVTTLDGQTHELMEDVTVIDDGHELVDLCGIMGGMASMINPKTEKIWLHAPVFNPTLVRRAMRALGHISDAAIIYEKGVDDELASDGLARAMELILQLCPKSKVASVVMDIRNRPTENRTLKLSSNYANKLIGTKVEDKKIISILKDLGFGVKKEKGGFAVTVPSFRLNDVRREADLVEEIARIYGYNNLPYITPTKDISPVPINKRRREERLAKEMMKGFGFDEIYTFAFLGPELLKKTGMGVEGAIELANPISGDLSLMRQSLLPRTLETVAANLRYHKSFRIFEISKIYLKKGESHEERSSFIAAVVGGAHETDSFRVLQGVNDAFGLPLRPTQKSFLHQHSGRNAEMLMRGKVIGHLYEVHPQILRNFDIKERVSIMEMDVESLHEMDMTYRPKYQELPKFPAVTLDVSLMIPRKNLAADYLEGIEKADKLVRCVKIIDEYDGKELGSDKRALTYSITYQADDRTLTDEEVETVHQQVLKLLTDKGAEVRS